MLATTYYTGQHQQEYQEQGYTLLPGLLSAATAAALYKEVLQIIAARNMPDSYLAQTSDHLAGSGLDELMHGAELRHLVGTFMGGASSLYLPFTAVKGPRQGAFGFHQDNQYTRHDGPSCNCWIALGPCTAANGCLRIVPGSHHDGTRQSKAMFVDEDGNESHRTLVEEPEHYVDIELQPGDAVLFDRLTIHGSGPNNSDEPRVAYAVQYHRNDTRWYDAETDSWPLLLEQPRWQERRIETLEELAAQA